MLYEKRYSGCYKLTQEDLERIEKSFKDSAWEWYNARGKNKHNR